jgi:hypothetical protein
MGTSAKLKNKYLNYCRVSGFPPSDSAWDLWKSAYLLGTLDTLDAVAGVDASVTEPIYDKLAVNHE